ncbi:transporter substrate-binding protein [Bradyrhizobium sp. 2]|nr:transporter substrate-binding protein [Bradyrhizobium sp. 48]MCK1460227.1 transporter substrate-binding protein [Bradyrhizobium sp. 2]
MISTVAGVLIKQQVDARQIQFMALSVSEHELRSVDLGKLAGHLAARNTSSLSNRSKTTRSSECGRSSTNNATRPPTVKRRRLTSASGCGLRRSAKPARSMSRRSGKPCTDNA